MLDVAPAGNKFEMNTDNLISLQKSGALHTIRLAAGEMRFQKRCV